MCFEQRYISALESRLKTKWFLVLRHGEINEEQSEYVTNKASIDYLVLVPPTE